MSTLRHRPQVSALGRSGFDAIKDLYEEKQTFTTRIYLAIALCFVMIGLLGVRLVDLQLIQHDYFSTRADENRMRLIAVAPVRGLIYDRNGALLAQNLPSFVVEITPEQVTNLDDTLTRLGQYIQLTDRDIARFRERLHKGPRYRAVTLRSNLSPEEVARYELNRYEFEGVEVKAGLVRAYPLGESAAHVIGYVGGISDADYATLTEADYQGLTQIGKAGVERSHENDLRGQPGAKIIEANAAGRPLRELDARPGKSGQNLYLSLDAQLQLVAEKAFGDLDGAVVALDPRTGEVLALVSKPGFDPTPFVEGIDNATYRALLDDTDRPLYNRALLGTYPPGSTIKPFIASAALQYGTLNPSTRVVCTGSMGLPNSERKYRCWKRHGHGSLDMAGALAKSCDIYFYQAALNLGIDRIDEVLGEFGFGKPTALDIPNEKGGVLPSREWKRRLYKQAWFPGETLNMGIGQGYLTVTPMQLAQATARLAMRGAGFKPHILHAVGDAAGGAMTAVPGEPLNQIATHDPGLYEKVINAMNQVAQVPGGTAYAVFKDAPYTVAAKTGTAQVAGLKQDEEVAPKQDSVPLRLRDHAIFMAFAPVDQPRIAIAVIAEHAGHGGTAAAPVARQVMDQYLLGKVLYNVKAGQEPLPAAVPEAPGDDAGDDPVEAVPPNAGPGTPDLQATPVPPQ
jgi:penicillin-binding protein 2